MTKAMLTRAALLALGLGVIGTSVLAPQPAAAQSCQDDFQKFAARRQGLIDQLNKMSKGGKGQMDPAAACPRLRSLASVEREMGAYMQQNKDWCSIPDDALENVKKGSARTAQLADRACKVAGDIARARKQAEAGAAPVQRLPAGPL